MIIRILVMLLAVAPLSIPADAGLWDSFKSIFSKGELPQPLSTRILIVHDQHGIVLEVKGKYAIYDPKTNEHISTRFIGKRKFIQALSDGIKWGEEFPGVHQLLIVPEDSHITTVVDGIEYRGKIYIYDIGGTISVVNQVDVEDYLTSLLAPKYKEPLAEETMAAIAIAARTNAYYQALNPKNTYWDINANQVGYLGYAVTNSSSDIERAIEATRYMVMSKSGSEPGTATPFPAVWSNAGKKVDNAENSKISLSQADDMANKGDHAAQILAKAFPNTTILLMHYAPPAQQKVPVAK